MAGPQFKEVLTKFDQSGMSGTATGPAGGPLEGLSYSDLYFYFVWQETNPERNQSLGGKEPPKPASKAVAILIATAFAVLAVIAALFQTWIITAFLAFFSFSVLTGAFKGGGNVSNDKQMFMSVKPARVKLDNRKQKTKLYRNEAGALVVKYVKDSPGSTPTSTGLYLYHANGQLIGVIPDRKMLSTKSILIDSRELLALWWPNRNRFFVDARSGESHAWNALEVLPEPDITSSL